MPAQKVELLGGFHALPHHPQLQAARHRDDGRHHRGVHRIVPDVAHVTAVDLDRGERKAPQCFQARQAGAEAVDTQPHPAGTQRQRRIGKRGLAPDQRVFCDLELERAGWQAGALQCGIDCRQQAVVPQLGIGQVDRHRDGGPGMAPRTRPLAGCA